MQQPVDHFTRALNGVLHGINSVESFAKELVTAAVEETLDAIALEYGLKVRNLREQYVRKIVDGYFATRRPAGTVCKGKTARGKPCSQKAFVGGFCAFHQDQLQIIESKKRRLASYKSEPVHKESVFSCLPCEPLVSVSKKSVAYALGLL